MGFTNTRTASKCDEINTEDGKSMQPKVIGRIPVVQHDKIGMKVKKIVCKEFTHTPSGRFSMFSMSKSVNEVYALYGDVNSPVLWKCKNEVKFDIKITTTK